MLAVSDDMDISDGEGEDGGEAYTQAADAKPKSSDQQLEEMGLPSQKIGVILDRLKAAEDEYEKTQDEDLLPVIAEARAELEEMGIVVSRTDPKDNVKGVGVSQDALHRAEKKAEQEEAKRKHNEEKARKSKEAKSTASPTPEGKPQSKLMKKLSNPVVIGCGVLMLVSAVLLVYSMMSGGDGKASESDDKKSD